MGTYQPPFSYLATDEESVLFEWQRMLRLENAIINYGGGLTSLIARVEAQSVLHKGNNPEVAKLLEDINDYFHDVAVAGQLDLRDRFTFLQDSH